MLLLFCDNLDSPDLPPAAGAFLKQKAPSICLTVGGIPLLFARILSRRIYSFEKVRSAQENADVLEDSIQEYLSVPEQIVKADILSFSYREDSGHLSVSGAASNLEIFLYKWDQDLCIYDGKNTFSLPHDEISSMP